MPTEPYPLRRSDRAVTDPIEIADILARADCCRVGFADGDSVYIVPLNYGFVLQDGLPVFYFHGAAEGRKAALAAASPRVGYELDTDHAPVFADSACGHTFLYRSILGKGMFSIVTGEAERLFGMQCILRHMTGRGDWPLPAPMLEKTAIFRLTAVTLTAKAHV